MLYTGKLKIIEHVLINKYTFFDLKPGWVLICSFYLCSIQT